jgi:hypothetical protein
MRQARQRKHFNGHTLARPLSSSGIFGAVLLLAGCNQPPEKSVDLCRQTALARGDGLNLTTSDLGELIEECMSEKGYILKKDSDTCHHDAASAQNKNCYYPNTRLGRFFNG